MTGRVAVLDFDPEDGTLSPPVPFQPPGGRRNLGRYQLGEGANIHAVASMKVSVFATVLRTDDPRQTERCVDYLRSLAKAKTSYNHRGCDLDGTHPFREATFEVLAAEEDTTAYHRRPRPLALGVGGGDGPRANPALLDLVPPPGVDAGAFLDLVAARRRGSAETLLEIDRAANNTSIVFILEWRGWRLLFSGRAERRSWRTIKTQLGTRRPVHFLKVGRRGTPSMTILDEIVSEASRERLRRKAVVCTCTAADSATSHRVTLDDLRRRCRVASAGSREPGRPLELASPG